MNTRSTTTSMRALTTLIIILLGMLFVAGCTAQDDPDVAAADCPEATAELQRLDNPAHGYCLLYPAEYKLEKPNQDEVFLVNGSLLNSLQPMVGISVMPAAGKTAAEVAEALVAEYPAEMGIQRSSTTVGGETAEVLDKVPGQDVNRRVFVVHQDRLYQMMFMPVLDGDNKPVERLEDLYQQVLDSLVFTAQSDEVVDECLVATGDLQLVTDEALGFCLLAPGEFSSQQPNESETVLFVGSLLDVEHPRLYIRMTDAAGKTAAEAADALVAEFPADFGIQRTFGLTLGFELAEQLDNVPGQDIRRMLYVTHNGRLYELTFVPASEDAGEVYTQMEALFELVSRSFRFLP